MIFNPILLDITEHIDTERLQLRAVRPGDGVHHFPAVQESIGNLRQYLADLPWVKCEPSLTNSEIHCRENYCRFIKREGLAYFIYSKQDNQFIGGIGLHRIDWTIPKFEIGYWCRSSAQGKGYITEAVEVITKFAFNTLLARRVEIRADDLNVASWKVAEKTGFPLEGILRNVYRDTVSEQLGSLRVYAKISAG